jgi:uncharacterized protein (TIGR02145 family)
MKMIQKTLLGLICLLLANLTAQNTAPSVTNVEHSYNSTTGVITITYDVVDNEEGIVNIIMEVSDDGGQSFDYACTQVSGDVGDNVNTGTGKTITWQHDTEHGTAPSGENFIIKIVADDIVGDEVYYAGQIYSTVTIGDQVWFKENLNIGTRIDGSQNMTDNGAIEKYCYDDNPTHCATYGGLYQWDEMMQYSTDAGNRGICPEGWHIPREIEYNLLKSTTNQDGNALKAVGEGAGTNTSGFSALLSGNRDHTGTFEAITTYTGFWTSDGSGISGFFKSLTENGGMFDEGGNKTNGYSIRCVLDYLGEPDSPNLGFPANHTDNWSTTTDITWSIPHKTEWFSLQIASDELFSNLLFSDNQLNQNSETLAYLDYNTTYYWRVKANNSYGASDWSTPSAFTTVNDNVTFDPCPGVNVG